MESVNTNLMDEIAAYVLNKFETEMMKKEGSTRVFRTLQEIESIVRADIARTTINL